MWYRSSMASKSDGLLESVPEPLLIVLLVSAFLLLILVLRPFTRLRSWRPDP